MFKIYKILIKSTHFYSGSTVHTVIAEFDTRGEALTALDNCKQAGKDGEGVKAFPLNFYLYEDEE